MAKSRIPRLKDVAEAANVSVSAASKILRGDDSRFSKETCDRVLAASKKLGWRRNLLVSGIQTGRTRTIGVLIPPYDSFWVKVLSGVHQQLGAADYLPITVWQGDLDHMPQFEANETEGILQINRLIDRRVDGLIMWPAFGLAYQRHLEDLTDKDIPLVMIDHSSQEPFCDTVTTNEVQAARAVSKHLLDLGHRRIACISSRESSSQTWALERRTEFERAVQLHPEAKVQSWRLNKTGSNGVDVALEMLASDFSPSAVFAVTDHEAQCVYEAAITLGYSIPGDISVVGFSDLDFASTLTPPLSTVRQRPFDIGAKAASMVLERLDAGNKDNAIEQTKIEADLILRDSTGPVSG